MCVRAMELGVEIVSALSIHPKGIQLPNRQPSVITEPRACALAATLGVKDIPCTTARVRVRQNHLSTPPLAALAEDAVT